MKERDARKKRHPLGCLELVEKVVKWNYRGYEGVGSPLPTAVILGKFDWKPLSSGHFPKTKAAAIASPVDTPPLYASLFL
ncbi:hypothetical protein QJ48_22095 [Paenibacillus sp. A3]|nr:hypothetical protein QJ48_22095 [Paenibacillus sp. A3]